MSLEEVIVHFWYYVILYKQGIRQSLKMYNYSNACISLIPNNFTSCKYIVCMCLGREFAYNNNLLPLIRSGKACRDVLLTTTAIIHQITYIKKCAFLYTKLRRNRFPCRCPVQ